MSTATTLGALLSLLSLSLVACDDSQFVGQAPSGPWPEPAAFSLSVPQDQWQASKFCGDVKPEIPEDPTPPYRFEQTFLNDKLSGDGLTGWVHGAVPQYQQYTFTYRLEDTSDPMAFFKAEQFSLIPTTPELAETLKTLNRHDKISLKGSIFENGSPLKHIKVTGIEMLAAYPKATESAYGFDIATLKGKTQFKVFGQVHAMVASEQFGRAIVLEYKDFILPIAVPARHDAVAATLYRGDIVNVAVKVVEKPHQPPHFILDDSVEQAVEVIDPMLNCHNRETTISGYLAKFEKSPAIKMDTYAIRVVDANGIGRNFTLFVDMVDDASVELFFALGAKAAAAWDGAAEAPTVVRNYWKKESVKISAKGRLNVVSTEQANPQIYMTSLEDLVITPAP